MKTKSIKRFPIRHSLFGGAILAALLAIAFAPLPAAAQTIFWGAPTTISGDTDVSTLGTFLYAYTGGTTGTVNTVAFTAQTSGTTWGSVSFSGLGSETTSAYGSATAPFSNLTSAYKGILQGGAYGTSGSSVTVTLGGLTANTRYMVQVWLDDSRGTTRTATTSGNGVTLTYCSTGSTAGGVGQYVMGYFIPTGTSATFTLTASVATAQQLNAIQVRSLGTATLSAGTWTKNTTGVQSWGTAGNWSSSAIAEGNTNNANFNTLDLTADLNPQLDQPRVINSLTFGDTTTATAGGWLLNGATAASCILVLDGTTPTITANALGTGKVTTIGATLSGNSGLTKAGAGTLTLSNTTAYSGNTTINASSGTLQIGGAAQLFFGSYSGTISIGGGSMFEYSSSAAQTLSGAISGSGVLVKDTGTGTLILSALNTYTGNTTNNAGTLQISGSGSLNSGSYAGNIALGGGATLEFSSSAAQTLSGVISGGGALTKDTASSTLTLTGANTYTGATTINAGTLAINSPGSLAAGSAVTINSGASLAGTGTINGTVSVGSSGNLAPGGSGGIGTIGTLTLGNGLSLNSGSLVTCDLGTTSGSSDLIAITGGLVLNGTSTVVFNIPSGGAAANATYTIMTFTGSPTGGGTLVFPNGTTTINGATIHINSGSVTITTGASGITGDFWAVAGSGTWDINTTANWKINGTTGQKYTDGDAVTFDDSIGSGKNPTISGGTVNPSSVNIVNNANSYTITATIGGTGALTQNGTGSFTLNAPNTYSGGTTINSPSLNALNNAAFGTGPVTLNNVNLYQNTTVNFANNMTMNGVLLRIGGGASHSITCSGGVTLGTGGISMGGDGSTAAVILSGGITVNSSGSSITAINDSFGGSITTGTVSGTGGVLSLTNLGGGLTISAPISGAFNIYNGAGTVTLSGANPSFTGTTRSQAGTLSIGNVNTLQNATLDMNAADSGSVSFGQASTLGALTGSRNLATSYILSIGNNSASTTYSGVLSGGGGLTKIGTGALTLGGVSTYTGSTTVNASGGTLAINSSGELYTPNYIATPVVTVNSGATLSLYAWTYAALGSIGDLDLGAAHLAINGGTVTYTGVGEGSGAVNQARLFTIGTGGATLDAEGTGTWYLEANSSYDGTAGQVIPSSLMLTLTGAGNGRYDKILSGPGSLIKSGVGTWTLAGVNTYTGDTTVNSSSGTLQIGGAGQLNSGSYAGTVSIGSSSTFKYSSSASQTLSGTISGSGALTKDTSSASTLTLSGTASYSGVTTVSAGTLIVPSTHSGTGAASVSANATLGVTASGTSQWKPASLTLANPCTLTFSGAQNSGTTTAPILPTAAVGTVSGVAVKVSSISGTANVGNSYPLLGNVSSTIGYTLNAQPVGVVGHLAVNGTTLVYVVDTVSDIWAGTDVTQPTYWTIGNVGTATNWTGYAVNNSPAYTFAQNDYVLFDDTASPASPVSVALQAAVTPSAVTFNNSTKSYTVTSSGGNMIGGSGSLTMNNSGKVILAGGTNGYTGGTVLNAGTLEADATGALSTGLVTLSGGALSNNVSATLANSINLSSASTVGVGSSQILTLSSAVTNSGALTKQGAGTLTLSGNNNFSGAVAVNAGTLNFSGGTTTYGSSSINVNNQLAQNSTLQFSGGSFTAGGSAGTPNLNVISNATLYVSGSASVILPGIVSLGTAGTGSSGNLTLSGGTLNINGYDSVNNNRALIIGEYSSETSTFTLSGGTLNVPNGRTHVGWTGTGIWNLYGGTANVNQVALNTGTLTVTNGLLNIGSGGIVSDFGTPQIYLGGGTVSSSASWSTKLNATLTNLNGNVTFAPASGQTITWGGVLSGSTGGLNAAGPGTLTLTNANTYTGNTTISVGTLALSGSGSIANTPQISVATGAALDVSAVTPSGYSLNSSGTLALNLNKTGSTLTQGQVAIGAKTLTYAGALSVTASGSGTLASGDSFTLVTKSSGSFSGWFNSVTLPSLASGISWDTNYLATTGVLNIYSFTTTPLALSTAKNTAATIAALKLSRHASSANAAAAYPTGWTATVSTAPGNGTASFDGSGNLLYTPTTGYSGSDSFTCTFNDGHGWQTMAVSVTVGSGTGTSPNVVSQGIVGSNYVVNFAGIPGYSYSVETNSVPNGSGWVKWGTITAATNGAMQVVDPMGSGSLFYRTVYPSY